MREISVREANQNFSQVIAAAERGETIVVTRHGRAIARIVPEAYRQREEADRAMGVIKALGKGIGKITVAELLSARDAGKY